MPLRARINDSPFTRQQMLVVGICFVLNMLDGMDVLAIAYAAPLIAAGWSLTPQALGIAFSAALVGMTIGAIFISPYTDIIGRRNMIIASLSLIALGMMATAFAQSVSQLIILRLIAGLGIGSMLASLTSMVSEYAPERNRNMCVLFLQAGYPIGAIITGFVAAWLLPEYGWRSLFIFAAITSMVAVPLVVYLLPESLEFLVRKQPEGALQKINRILAKMDLQTLNELPEVPASEHGSGRLTAVLSPNLRTSTLWLWLAFFMSFATLYFLLSWVVKLAVDAGMALEDAMFVGIALNLGAFIGALSLGYLSSRLGLKRMISIFFLIGAIASIVYGNSKVSVPLTLLLIFVMMFFVQGAFIGLYAVAARLYPTEIRTTGIGWSIGAGRIGAILGPALAGFILGAGVSIGWTFFVFAIPIVIAAIAVVKIPSKAID